MKTRVSTYRKYLFPYERKYMKILLRVCKGVVSRMAMRAGTSRIHILRLIRRHKLQRRLVDGRFKCS